MAIAKFLVELLEPVRRVVSTTDATIASVNSLTLSDRRVMG